MSTVQEVINKLKEFDPNLPVYFSDSEYGAEEVEVDIINSVEKESWRNDPDFPTLRVQI